jgi:long-subunit fatty acid transport protein
VLKGGAIIKATDWLRLGGSIQTPTYNFMTETYSWGIVANYDGIITNNNPYNTQYLNHADVKTTTNSFNYRFVKPMRASAGVTLLAGKKGFITGDVEFVPYKTASLQYPGDRFLFAADNATIKNLYNNVFNYKLGAEWKVTKEWTLRGGYAYYADPYHQVDDLKRDQTYFTFGGGYRIEGFYVDLAVVQGFSN